MAISAPVILLLCEDERSARLDRKALRDCGFIQTRVESSGIAAASMLARMAEEGERIDLVVCHERFSDMRFDQFIGIIRAHPLLENFPVLLILSNGGQNSPELAKREALGILERPYSLEDLKKKMVALIADFRREKLSANAEVDASAFRKALESYGLLLRQERSPDDYFHMGMDFLKEQNWNLALSAFQKSVHDHRLKAEAELGMAAAYKGNNDLLHFRLSLASAAESFVQSERWNRGRSAFARLLQHDKSAKNPFLTEAHKFIKTGAYQKASEIIQESLPLIPKGHIGSKLARLCFLADDPEKMLDILLKTLANGRNELLKTEIVQNLKLLIREREERERQKAAERKWELGRKLAKAREKEEKAAFSMASEKPELRPEERIALLEDDSWEEGGEDYIDYEIENDADDEAISDLPILAPLSKPEATSDLFAKKPKFNEFLSVVKLTWKLARRSRKKD